MIFKSLAQGVSKVSGKVPLRLILVIPFVLQIFAAVGLVGYLSYRNSKRAVNDVATQLLEEVNARVEQNLDAYLTIPHLVNQINATAINLGQLNLQDIPQLERYFWRQLQIFNTLTFTGLGLENKDNLGAERLDDGTLILRVSSKASNHIFYSYSTNESGERCSAVLGEIPMSDCIKKRQEILDSIKFDPRTRPWYRTAVKAGRSTWSEIYPNTAGVTAYLGASMPFYDKQDQLQGVLLTNINLSQIGKFLRSINVGKTGQVFIIERSGMLVATSTGEKPFRTTHQDYGAERFKATDSSNAFTKATAQYLSTKLNQKQPIQRLQQWEFAVDGKRKFVQIQPFQDEFGLDWLIVVVVPEADFIEQIHAHTRTTIALCLVALLLATEVGIVTSRWVVRPIVQLKDAAIALEKGQFDQIVNQERSDELGVLVKAFNHMARQLQESFATLEAKNTELQHLDQLKNEFLANTSQELRTPLNGMISIAESLMDGVAGQLPSKANANLAIIASSGKRLGNLVNDLLDFSKLKHKHLELQIKPVSMREIANLVLGHSHSLIAKKPLQLINSIPADLPLVDADENRLQQILYNLIENAIKFTESGKVEVSAEQLPVSNDELPMLVITVSDTGIGIPADKLHRIFDSFESVDCSRTKEYGGRGLGLAVTRQLVELHGGKIHVRSLSLPEAQFRLGGSPKRSQNKSGSQFTFTLPVSQRQVQQTSALLPIESIAPVLDLTNETPNFTGALAADSGYTKIFIVDDEPVNRQVITNYLSMENYAIATATNGLEALEMLSTGFQPDLILLDVMMPRMTGYEVCEKIRQKFLPSELPVIMLTANNQVSDLVEGFTCGVNDYLTKPFSKHELLARIKSHLRLSKITSAYGKFVPHDFLRFLGYDSIVDVKLGDHVQKEMTVLFADIRSFTSLSEQLSPQENFNFINSYLSRVSPAIRAHNGFIDKYIGDGVMALFPESADDGVQGALEMQQTVAVYNQHRCQSGYVPITIGIGLHTGSLMLGTIGEQKRMESTVISDAVNLASRLEGLTKLYGAGIMISQQTLYNLNEFQKYSYRFLDRVKVKGKNKPVAVFELFDQDQPQLKQLKRKTKSNFEQAAFLYHRQAFAQAEQIFQSVLQTNPQDKAAMLYVKRCQRYQTYGVPEDWERAEALHES
ncbi:response regulator [Moorena producens]|uniref:response regulator n=1 Tax=Moorena producens TaxID=1155739 RepID=UPI003C747E7B